MASYSDEQKQKIIAIYEHFRELNMKRKQLLEKLESWYNTQVLGLIPKKSYKVVEFTEWVKPNDHRSTEHGDPAGDRSSAGA